MGFVYCICPALCPAEADASPPACCGGTGRLKQAEGLLLCAEELSGVAREVLARVTRRIK